MNAKEKQASAEQTFVFLRSLTSKAPAKQAGERVSAGLRVKPEAKFSAFINEQSVCEADFCFNDLH